MLVTYSHLALLFQYKVSKASRAASIHTNTNNIKMDFIEKKASLQYAQNSHVLIMSY